MPSLPRSRISHFINRRPASNIHHAIRVAEALGCPLNQLVTINLAHTACPIEEVSAAFERLRDTYFNKWVRRPPAGQGAACAPAFVWVIENSGGHLNVHWLVHVPPVRLPDFKERLPRWVHAVTGGMHGAEALHIRPAPTPRGAGRYMLKGIDPAFAEFYGIRHVPQGAIHGKRSGHSRCLGPVVRARLGIKGRRFKPFPSATRAAHA